MLMGIACRYTEWKMGWYSVDKTQMYSTKLQTGGVMT